MSTNPSHAPEDPATQNVAEHRELLKAYFSSPSRPQVSSGARTSHAETSHPRGNADAGSSTAASHVNVTSPVTAYSQSGASVTSEQQSGTAGSHPQSDGSVSAGSDVGPSVAQRRLTEKAKRAWNAQNLSNDDRPASCSSQGRSSDEGSEGQRTTGRLEESQEMEDGPQVIRGTGTYRRYILEEIPPDEPSVIQQGQKGRHLRSRVID